MRFVYFILIPLFFYGVPIKSIAQIVFVQDKETQTPIPFSIIKTNDSILISDCFGKVNVGKKQVVKAYRYDYEIKLANLTADTTIILLNAQKTERLKKTDDQTRKLITNVITSTANHPESFAPFHYKTYNKLIITSNHVEKAKNKLAKILSTSMSTKINSVAGSHHFVLGESVTERNYLNALNEEEIIKYSKLVGVKKANLFTVNSQINSFSMYEKFITIARKDYTNPLYSHAFKRYHFQIEDVIPRKTDTLFFVRFNPRRSARFESLKGVYVVSSNYNGLYGAALTPALASKTSIFLIQQGMLVNTRWFPEYNLSQIIIGDIAKNHTHLIINSQSRVNQIVIDTTFNKKDFTDVAIYYDKNTIQINRSEKFWKNHRSIPFTSQDKKTYELYRVVGEIQDFSKYIKIAENLYYKKLYLKWFNVDLTKVMSLNEHEGLRLGLGLETNQTLSEKITFSAYTGYGLKDQQIKYGGKTSYRPSPLTEFSLSYSKDVFESGKVTYLNSRPMYSSEWLRKLRVNLMDQVEDVTFNFGIHPVRYTDIQLFGSVNEVTPRYTYQYKNSEGPFTFNEIGVKGRFAFGETFFILEQRKFPFYTPYPVFYINYTKGINGFSNDNFTYSKINAKAEFSYRFIVAGESLIQLNYGYINGELPYYKLYNGKGSRDISTVAHNSFETMRYNEFLSDQFITLFYTHDFGNINFLKNKNFKPRAHIAFNAGWGSLRNRDNHEGINFNTMEKGYYEIGGLIKNLLQIKITVMKIGFGIGYYHRLGPYARDQEWDNAVLKVATTFGF